MKRKTIVLLSSVMASALLVGGAFAAYAVTDNAEERGIYTTPGTITPTQTVTLEWGTAAGLSDVSDLVPATPKKAGEVSLVATANDANIYTGNLLVHYEDRTTIPEAQREAKFIDYLNVYVYEGSLEEPDADKLVGSLIAQEANSTLSKNIEATGTAAGKLYSIFIELDTAAQTVVEKIQNDRVYVGFDWNKANGDYNPVDPTIEDGYYLVGSMNNWAANNNYKLTANTQAESENEYYITDVVLAATDEFKVKYHGDPEAWFPDGEDNNVQVPEGTYDIYFSSVYRADWATGVTYEDAFGREGYFWFSPKSVTPTPTPGGSETPSVDPGQSQVAPSETPVSTVGYYLVGTINGWTEGASYKFEENTGGTQTNEYHLDNVVLTATDEFKAKYNGEQEAWFPAGQDNNIVVPAGTYNIYFSPDYKEGWVTGSTSGDQFGREGHFWFAPQSVEPTPGTSEEPAQSQVPQTSQEQGSQEAPSVAPAEQRTLTATCTDSWAFKDVPLFAWVWGEGDEGHWVAIEYDVKGVDEVTFEVAQTADGFLLVRCAAGTTTPDWSIQSGTDAGRIYNKTANVEIGTASSYEVTFVDYPVVNSGN